MPTVRPALALVTAALLLAACGAPPPPAAPSAGGEAYRFDAGQPDVLAVGFAMLDPTFLPAAELARADLVEVDDGVWFGNFVGVDADDGFGVALPAVDDIPVATLVPLAAAVDNFVSDGCAIDAAPVGAEATFTVFEGVTLPGLVALTPEGSFLMGATDAGLAPGESISDFDGTFYGWIYVDRAATLATSGCDYTADLALAQGWNQLGWTLTSPTTISVEVVPASDVLATPLFPFPLPPMVVVGD